MKIRSLSKYQREASIQSLKISFQNLIKKLAIYSLVGWFGVVFVGWIFYTNFSKYEVQAETVTVMAIPAKPTIAPTSAPTKIDIIQTIKPIFDKAGVPISTWLTIAMCESDLNTHSMLDNKLEISKGLFQINVVAHPKYKDVNLFDPIINAEIACKDFISHAYAQAKNISCIELTRALITYSGLYDPYSSKSKYINNGAGIRPRWTAQLRSKFINTYNAVKVLREDV